MQAPSGVGDSYTGTNLAMQVLAAILQRQHTGRGQYVKAALFHVGAFAMASMLTRFQRPYGAQLPMTRWDANPTATAFCCADGEWIFLSGVSYETLFKIAGKEELLDDPIWKPENAATTKKERYDVIKALMLTKTREEWMAIIDPLGTPTVRLAHFADLCEDEQAWVNGYVERVEYPTGNADIVPSIPLDMECLERGKTQKTRRLGQDTVKVLSELGYTQEQIQQLAADGAIIS